MWQFILLVPGVWLLKSAAYAGVFHLREIECTYMSCLIIAGAPLLLSVIPLPLPGFLGTIAGAALAVSLTMRYTGVALLPEGLCIPLAVEGLFIAGTWAVRGIL